MIDPKALIGAAMLALLVAPGVQAHGNKNGHYKNGKITHAVPGPVAGVGLPILAVFGGYVWYRKRAKQRTG